MPLKSRTAIQATNIAVGAGVGLITPTPGAPAEPWDTEGLGRLKAKRWRGKKKLPRATACALLGLGSAARV